MAQTQPTAPNALNLFQRMGRITAELQTVAKNMNVSAGKGSYKAVSERDIIDAVKPLEEKWGVYSYPASREILDTDVLESIKGSGSNAYKSTTFFSRIKTIYRFVNMDNPSEYIETTTFAEGMDTGDKGSGKAMTYADKYALMKAYKISTGDDPDKDPSVDANYRRAGWQQPPQPQMWPGYQYPPQGYPQAMPQQVPVQNAPQPMQQAQVQMAMPAVQPEKAQHPATQQAPPPPPESVAQATAQVNDICMPEQKRFLMELCKEVGANWQSVLAKAGWKSGDLLTMTHFNAAVAICKDMSEAKHGAKG